IDAGPESASEAPDGLADALGRTPAPAVGTLAYGTAQELANGLQEYAGTGIHAGDGRDKNRATVLHADRQPNGHYLLTIDSSRYVHPMQFHGAESAVVDWLRDELAGLRATTDLPLLLVASERAGLSGDDLAPVAVEATCLVAIAVHDPAAYVPRWEPTLLEAKPAPAPVVEPERKLSAAQRVRAGKPGVAGWLARVPELVVGWPESIPGPDGQRVVVRYGQRDPFGREYVTLEAFMENPRWGSVPMEL